MTEWNILLNNPEKLDFSPSFDKNNFVNLAIILTITALSSILHRKEKYYHLESPLSHLCNWKKEIKWCPRCLLRLKSCEAKWQKSLTSADYFI